MVLLRCLSQRLLFTVLVIPNSVDGLVDAVLKLIAF